MLKFRLYPVFLLLVLNSYLILSIPNHSINKKDECKPCKVLTDSFEYWLKKTSRGKFEGGDAAWEESKLKAYARSEIRFVEIQEGLCSELKIYQNECYKLAEESEQSLEQWWLQIDSNTNEDLYTWLCIKMLKFCCPTNHFGLNCEQCPINPNNSIICGGHGTCDGDSTRQGTGNCVCDRGYEGNYCEKCTKNFYTLGSNQCIQCHETCNECRGEGADNCISCRPGWLLESRTCLDVDECTDHYPCKINQYCINNKGSYTCNGCDKSCVTCEGAGPYKCTSCKIHWSLWNGICLDERIKSSFTVAAIKKATFYSTVLLLLTLIYNTSKGNFAVAVALSSVLFFYIQQPSVAVSIYMFETK